MSGKASHMQAVKQCVTIGNPGAAIPLPVVILRQKQRLPVLRLLLPSVAANPRKAPSPLIRHRLPSSVKLIAHRFRRDPLHRCTIYVSRPVFLRKGNFFTLFPLNTSYNRIPQSGSLDTSENLTPSASGCAPRGYGFFCLFFSAITLPPSIFRPYIPMQLLSALFLIIMYAW